jgi:hypothetical protein
MERVETLIKKLQEQLAAKTPAAQMLITAQMLQAELLQFTPCATAGNCRRKNCAGIAGR